MTHLALYLLVLLFLVVDAVWLARKAAKQGQVIGKASFYFSVLSHILLSALIVYFVFRPFPVLPQLSHAGKAIFIALFAGSLTLHTFSDSFTLLAKKRVADETHIVIDAHAVAGFPGVLAYALTDAIPILAFCALFLLPMQDDFLREIAFVIAYLSCVFVLMLMLKGFLKGGLRMLTNRYPKQRAVRCFH